MTLRICHCSDLEDAVDDPERTGRVTALLDRLRGHGPTLVVDGFEPLAPEQTGVTHAHQHDALETHLRRTDGPVELEGRIVVERGSSVGRGSPTVVPEPFFAAFVYREGASRLSSDWESTRLKIELSSVQIGEAAYSAARERSD